MGIIIVIVNIVITDERNEKLKLFKNKKTFRIGPCTIAVAKLSISDINWIPIKYVFTRVV